APCWPSTQTGQLPSSATATSGSWATGTRWCRCWPPPSAPAESSADPLSWVALIEGADDRRLVTAGIRVVIEANHVLGRRPRIDHDAVAVVRDVATDAAPRSIEARDVGEGTVCARPGLGGA